MFALLLGSSMAEPDPEHVNLYPPPLSCDPELSLPTDSRFALYASGGSTVRALRALEGAELVSEGERVPVAVTTRCAASAIDERAPTLELWLSPLRPLAPESTWRLEAPALEDLPLRLGCDPELFVPERRRVGALEWRTGVGPTSKPEWWTAPPTLETGPPRSDRVPPISMRLPIAGSMPGWLELTLVDDHGRRLVHRSPLRRSPGTVAVEPSECGRGPEGEGPWQVQVAVVDLAGRRHPAPGEPWSLSLAAPNGGPASYSPTNGLKPRE